MSLLLSVFFETYSCAATYFPLYCCVTCTFLLRGSIKEHLNLKCVGFREINWHKYVISRIVFSFVYNPYKAWKVNEHVMPLYCKSISSHNMVTLAASSFEEPGV